MKQMNLTLYVVGDDISIQTGTVITAFKTC